MAMDLKWVLSADDKASDVFDKVKNSGITAVNGIESVFSGALGKFNLLTGAVGGLMAVAAGGVFSGIIKETVAWTYEAIALSKSLGITTQQASILNMALGDVYLSKETMLAGSSRIAKTLKTEEDAFLKLGVATRDQAGHYRSTLDIMTDVNTKLGTLREGTDRNIAGMSIYGKSWGELSGLIKLNSEAMQDAEEKARRLGMEVGEEGVSNAKKYKAALNDIEDVSKSLTVRFGTVLLPALIKVGTFLGQNGPVLSDAFRWSLNALGYTVKTVGEWLGLMAYRAVSLGSVLKSVLTGNFSDAKRELQNLTAAGDDFNARAKAGWNADWSKDAAITSRVPTGEQLPTDFGADAAKAEAAQNKAVKLWEDKARKIIDIEKNRISTLITIEKEYLGRLKSEYEEHVKTLDTFSAVYTKVKDSIAARNKKDADDQAAALHASEDSYQRYYRQLDESAGRVLAIDADKTWTAESQAKKLEAYSAELDAITKIRDESKAAAIDTISSAQIDTDYLIRKSQIEEKIVNLGDQQEQQLTDIAVKAGEAMTLMERGLKLQEDQVKILDRMIKNLPDITVKTIQLKINGIQDLYAIQSLIAGATATTGAISYGDYYTMGGQTYWSDGSLADNGTSYAEPRAAGGPVRPYATYRVNENGTEFLTMGSQGGFISPAGQTAAAGGVTISGGITFELPNVTNQTSAKELARMVLPELQQLQSRYRKAA